MNFFDAYKLFKPIARSYGVKTKIIYFKKKNYFPANVGGGAYIDHESGGAQEIRFFFIKPLIKTAFEGSLRSWMTFFFHELGHILCYRHKKYFSYHSGTFSDYSINFQKTYIKKYGFKAELKADELGSAACKKYFPSVKYKSFYQKNKKRGQKFILKYWGVE